jgi:hypothetical protein
MFAFINNKKFRIYWKYTTTEPTKKQPSRTQTECLIEEVVQAGQNPFLVFRGWVTCHPNDTFKKEDGRIASLRKAYRATLDSLGLSPYSTKEEVRNKRRDIGEAIFRAYMRRSTPPPSYPNAPQVKLMAS